VFNFVKILFDVLTDSSTTNRRTTKLKSNFTSAATTDFQGSLLRCKLTTLPTVIRSFRRQIRI